MFRPGRVALLCALAALATVLAALPASAGAQDGQRRVVIAFWTAYPTQNLSFVGKEKGEGTDTFLHYLGSQDSRLSVGLWSSIQGKYSQEQSLLDVSQGTRQSTALYTPRDPYPMALDPATSTFSFWTQSTKRARDVSRTLKPGLLAGSVPGGGGYVGVLGQVTVPAIAAADEQGHVAQVSLGPESTLARRVAQMSASKRLVAVGIPPDAVGHAQLQQLIDTRPADELLMIAHLPPTPPKRGLSKPPPRYFNQPAFALAKPGKVGSVTSGTTRHDGLISSIDVLPTALDWLGIKVPEKVRGQKITVGRRISAQRLQDIRLRWTNVRSARQSPSMRAVAALGGIIFLLLGAIKGLRAALAPSLRIGALGLMWWPSAVLFSAVFEPGPRLHEIALIGVTAIAAAIITDRLIPWPRAPLLPCAVTLVFYTVDLAFGGELLSRSALGPSISFGGRFYGVSNELEPLLAITLLLGLAAFMTGRPITRRTPVLYAVAGLILGAIVGWGRLGADVGGVITVGMGVAVGTLVMLPGGITRRAILVTILVPFAAIGGLILLDLGLSGGDHLTRNLLRAENAGELWELVARRYELAFRVLRNGRTPAYFAGAALAVWFAVRNRRFLYGELPHRAWAAALIGGLAAGIAGMLTNDSGPVLLINAVLALVTITVYILAGTRAKIPEPAGRPPEAPSSAPGPRPADPVLTK